MIARLGTEGADLEEERLAETFARQVQYAMGLLKAHGVPVLVVPYRDAIEDPGSVAQRVAEFLGGDLDANVMAAAVDPSLYRERKP
jgi:hypothetical protein